MANTRNGIPAGWQWRAGRPRWVPSPTLRKAGWKGQDLKDALGRWLDRGASIDAAQAMVDKVEGWRRGEEIEAAPAPAASAADALSIGSLIDGYLADDALLVRKNGTARPRSTIADYRRKLKRWVDAQAGFAVLPALDKTLAARDPDAAMTAYKAALARYQAATAAVRAMSVFVLAPVDTGKRVDAPLRNAYRALQREAGVHMAYGVMSVVSAWLTWARKHRNTRIVNWAADVERETPQGRIRVASWPEVGALVGAADRLGLHEVGDAIVLSLALSWSQADILALTWDRIARDEQGQWRAFTGEEGRVKTGRKGGQPLLSMALRRLQAIRDRQAAALGLTAPGAELLLSGKVVVIKRRDTRNRKGPAEDRRREADAEYFRTLFQEVRDEAVKAVATVADVTFADMRDTGDTLGLQANLNDQQRAGRNLRSLKNNADLTDKHYGEIGPEITAAGHALLDPYVEAQLAKHQVAL